MRPTLARAVLVLALAGFGTACGDDDPPPPITCDPATEDCGGADAADDVTDPDGGSDVGVDAPPIDAGDDVDPTDGGDTASDADPDVSGPDVTDPDDTDGDGIPDDVEGDGDIDGDGIPNFEDDDSDGDGLPDSEEVTDDLDGDGLPGFLDTDSDGDGFSDAEEGSGDTDGDGAPDFNDTDADGDNIPDEFEGDVDSDGDGIIDRLDLDSDADGISDFYEGGSDRDEDGIPNYLDLDSDNDGHSDADEYGRAPGSDLPPLGSDLDRDPDFLDIDSDGDGLPDETELGCPESTERTMADSDGDDYSDLLEVAFAEEGVNQACDPDEDITDDVDFFFELPFLEDEQDDRLDFIVGVRRADVSFNMDTTGSMGGEISALQTSLTSAIFPSLAAEIENVAYAFAQWDDFPCDFYGGGADRPFILRQRVTTDIAAAAAGVMSLERHGGGDYFESGFESIYQTCTGFGRDEPSCTAGPEVAPFDPAIGYVEGVADGEIGGVGFREGSLPIIVHITDAPSHAKGDDDGYPYGASRNEAFAAMRAIGARLIGVASGSDAQADLTEMAIRAGSVVPTCAWTDPVDGTRPGGCLDGMCCTGSSGSGRPPEADGTCPLVYDIASSGAGLSDSVVEGIRALINFSTFDLTTRVRPDEDELEASGIDTSEFIDRVVPIEGVAPDTGCADDPVLADRDEDGEYDHFLGVVPGSRLTFDIFAVNTTVPPTNEPQVFTTFIDVVQQGGAVLDTQLVTVLVPPDLKPVQ